MIKKMDRKYVIRRRVVFGALGLIGLVAAYYLVNHIWWTGSSFCWGDMQKCVGGF
jgi:hypothetical protein